MTRELGISDDKVKNWIRGTLEPTAEEVQKICRTLGCSLPKEMREKTNSFPPIDEVRNDAEKSPETFVVGEVKADNKNKERVNEAMKTATAVIKEPKDDFMPKPVQEELFPKTTKEEKKMEDKKDAIIQTAVAEEKPKKIKAVTSKKTGKKTLLSEESEAFVRKNAGLKKSDELTEKAVLEAFKNGVTAIKQKMDELSRLEKDVTKALFDVPEATPVDDRLKKLLTAGEKASDEGIALAVTILEKFRK